MPVKRTTKVLQDSKHPVMIFITETKFHKLRVLAAKIDYKPKGLIEAYLENDLLQQERKEVERVLFKKAGKGGKNEPE